VQAEIEDSFPNDENHQGTGVAANGHDNHAAKDDGNMQHQNSAVGLHHELQHGRSMVLVPANKVHDEGPRMAGRQREHAP
jgi:hypothetical protein